MCYLKSDEKIFGITSYQKSSLKIQRNTVKCGIFDLNRLSWKCVADCKYKSEVNSLDITVCGNNKQINCSIKPMIWFDNNPLYCMHHSKSSN